MTIDNSIIEDLPEMGIELLYPDVDALKGYAIFNLENKDPFDNILIRIARNEKCLLITSDHKILRTKLVGLKLQNATE